MIRNALQRTCPACERTYDTPRCPRCRVAYMPTLAKIRAEAAVIRQGWSPQKLAEQEGNPPAEIPVVCRVSDGMVRRDGLRESLK